MIKSPIGSVTLVFERNLATRLKGGSENVQGSTSEDLGNAGGDSRSWSEM
ncbi:hypothetical protein MPTK1_8g04030 [Marchantia polymorpha subsp. ruderalis]|uniref:Uncharacterized protein n=1 Tax=Marchantia polymorpha TaxID=3197 RepID=A0A2R6XJG7_MARPO|nr:hypothetical protein MARPO_0012s0192 [Marchantia polymorpha]PTQ46269.1 hypothetical protein MARPO_0012s0192 [Marchantia polymorpha]PTQ46270.1 hypothetical protein MARPO_0012s0192 [Marchantia polymorpha]BBN18622.1 hypothetical protein Mp_8g04030 [Marchantia polymorpha subsp. ruderalis]BBN18623.1 hypothetical protein Mp_8g04030 [Marchantia polymorpha subsp. ruderalis]|eukprot:PTQ46268.1 hypothetical protein MARPO_0012s0192 [Marchantia polymorpha]